MTESRAKEGDLLIRPYLLPLAAVCVAALPVVTVNAASCYTQAEASAVQVRMLQSELMVAALACRDSNPELGMVSQYNEFVHRLGDRLVSHSRVLQAHFQKVYGADGRRRLEAFVTALANDASKRSMTSAGYCESAEELFKEVDVLDRRELERFSAAHAATLGEPVATCAATPPTRLDKRRAGN